VTLGVVLMMGMPGRAFGQEAKAEISRLEEATQLSSEAEGLYRAGKFNAAIPLIERALALREEVLGTEHPDVAASVHDLAGLYISKGDYAQAEPLFQRALAIREKALGTEHPDVAQCLNSLGGLYKTKGDYAQAETLYWRALAIREKALGTEHSDVATSLNNLATLYKAKGDYAQAETLYRRARDILEKTLGPEHRNMATSLSNLALLYIAKGDYIQAEPLARRALDIHEKALGPEHPAVAFSLNNLAQVYDTKRDYAQAEPLYRRALDIHEKALGPEHPAVATSLNNLAYSCAAKGDYAQAEPLYRRSLAIREKVLGTEHPDVGLSLNNLAGLYDDKGDYAQAEPLYRRSLAILEEALGTEHPGVATSLNNLASLRLALGDLTEGLRIQERAVAVQEHNAAVVLRTGSDEQKRAYMATLRGQTNQAISLHVQFAPDVQKAKRLAFATILHRKGRVLDAMTDSFAALRRRIDPAEQAGLDRLRSLSAEYSALVWRAPRSTSPLGEYRTTLARLDAERRNLEYELSLRSAELQIELQPISIERVQAAIPEGAALVELFRYEPFNPKAGNRKEQWGNARYVAYVVRREGEIQWFDLGEAAPIEAAIHALLPTFRRAAADPEPPARALDALVMQPIRRLLGKTRQVFLSPDGGLNLVPFAALRDEDGRYLVERYTFTYLTSGRDLMRLAATSASSGRPVILAAPDFDAATVRSPAPASAKGSQRSADMGVLSFNPLPFAATEGRALGQKLPEAQMLTGADATESAVKALQRPRLLHIATHGFFLPEQPELRAPSLDSMGAGLLESRSRMRPALYAENPLLRSGLAFAGVNAGRSGNDDGVLTALEAAQLDLSGTELVVLSACETAVGDVLRGEGVYGLRRALVIAGSETQVMSLWRVDDAATREQMEAYYGGLLHGGGRSEAMRQVQLAMLHNPERGHPYYWASFIVSGSPAALYGTTPSPDFARVIPGQHGCGCEVAAITRDNISAWVLGIGALGWARSRRRRAPGLQRS
jgi:CHAT domain-containing protein/tetratricopeptide (TPR) repeat protein